MYLVLFKESRFHFYFMKEPSGELFDWLEQALQQIATMKSNNVLKWSEINENGQKYPFLIILESKL